jgi:hypothetical protein
MSRKSKAKDQTKAFEHSVHPDPSGSGTGSLDWLFLFVSFFLIGSFSCNLIG